MNKKKQIVVFIMTAVMILTFTACGGSKTFEKYVEGTDIVQNLEGNIEGLTVSVDKNDVVFSYDMSKLGVNSKSGDKEMLAEPLEDALEQNAEMYEKQIKSFEDESEIKGITLTVKYTLDDEVIAEKTYTTSSK